MAVVEFVTSAARKDAIPTVEMENAWTLITLVMTSEAIWRSSSSDPPKSFEEVLSAGLNDAGGRVTEAALQLACAEYRANLGIPERQASSEQIEAAGVTVRPRLRPLLEHALLGEWPVRNSCPGDNRIICARDPPP